MTMHMTGGQMHMGQDFHFSSMGGDISSGFGPEWDAAFGGSMGGGMRGGTRTRVVRITTGGGDPVKTVRYSSGWGTPDAVQERKEPRRIVRIRSQNFKEIKEKCLAEKALWEDPDFPANNKSVYYSHTPANFEWKRPSVSSGIHREHRKCAVLGNNMILLPLLASHIKCESCHKAVHVHVSHVKVLIQHNYGDSYFCPKSHTSDIMVME